MLFKLEFVNLGSVDWFQPTDILCFDCTDLILFNRSQHLKIGRYGEIWISDLSRKMRNADNSGASFSGHKVVPLSISPSSTSLYNIAGCRRLWSWGHLFRCLETGNMCIIQQCQDTNIAQSQQLKLKCIGKYERHNFLYNTFFWKANYKSRDSLSSLVRKVWDKNTTECT